MLILWKIFKVWALLGQLAKSQKETERLFPETGRRFQQTERLLKEQSQKTDEQIRAVNKELGELGNRLGEFVEWQVRPAAVKLFRERGIAVRAGIIPGCFR
ncbi:hypothetical protein [Synechocystis sp. PCC 7338]|uniref:hypothetical protein n=1 Tax=Synechocystis sp. PCC 7338 TaxID=2732530 RepID=UPI001BAFF99E|nr:hypothetical protein [Synechocystis sp. PCC 7338]QUS59955.1 hypothetical protein HTZ78_04190 [Synechocystis sp. PCC 7338]